MKKILTFVLSFLFLFVVGMSIKVNATTIVTDENIVIVETGIQEGELQGLKFVGNIGEYDKANVAKYGILLAFGEVEYNESFVKKGTANDKRIIHAEVATCDSKGNFTVIIYGIPEDAYAQNISARPYIILKDNTIVYGGNGATTNALTEIAKAPEGEFAKAVSSKVSETHMLVVKGYKEISVVAFDASTLGLEGVSAIEIGKTLKLDAIESSEELIFGGWFDNAEFEGEAIEELVIDGAEVTIYAKVDDVLGPVVSIPEAALTQIAGMKFYEYDDLSKTLETLLSYVTIVDGLDGNITPTLKMVDLGGLNPKNAASGKYTVTIKCTDNAGNDSNTLELPLEVLKLEEAKVLSVDFEDGAGEGTYNNANWTQYKMDGSKWVTMSNNQMNSRKKVTKVANITGGWGQVRKFVYNENGKSFGEVNRLSIQMGNYYDPKKDISLKIAVVSSDGTVKYLFGNEDSFDIIPAGDNLVDYSFKFDTMEVKQIVFVFYSAYNGNQYVYLDNLCLYAPLAEITKLDFEDGSGNGTYNNSNWTQYKYDSNAWVTMSQSQMNSKKKVSKVVNIVGGWSQARKFIYNEKGESLGIAKKLSIELGNYFDPKKDIQMKLALVSSDGTTKYVMGEADKFYVIPAGDALVKYEFEIDEMEVKQIVLAIYSTYSGNQYLYIDNLVIKGLTPVAGEALDETAPVITVAPAALQTLAGMTLNEGNDLSSLFGTLLSAVSCTDDKDGTIAISQSNVDFGGLNVTNPNPGIYTITIKAKDAAGNEGKYTLPVTIHSTGVKKANLLLDFEEATVGQVYASDKWSQQWYNSDWVKTSGQMNAREKNGTKVVNMTGDWNCDFRYAYNEKGESIGLANKFTCKVGNYYTGASTINVKVFVFDENGNKVYLFGSETEFHSVPVTDGLIEISKEFDAINVQSLQFQIKTKNTSYLYVDDIALSYVSMPQ